ncbi:GAF domain-containing protein [Lutibacter litoralis]|uniref:histidine kinase n=1 Tax=Lutibacter litoralis TaxID=321268 RepID=A0ABV5K5L6_9FLAO|nr:MULTISPECIES: GAF domain-containing protein [Flavobacteriaceae]
MASNNLYSQKVVKVGAFNFYPAIFQDNDGEIKGFYVDAFHEIEAKENIQFQYVFGTWNEGLERIQNDEIDVMVSVAYTDERATYMDYCPTPLLTVWGDVYVKEAAEIHGVLDLEGKTIAIMKSDINGEQLKVLAEKLSINCIFIEKADFQEVFKSINSKEVDAGVVNNTFGTGKSEEYGLRSSGIIFNPFDIHLTVQKNKNTELLNLFDTYLDDWTHDANSVYNISRQKWSRGKVGVIPIIPKWLKNSLFSIIGITILLVVFVVLLRNRVKKATIKIKESETKFKILADNTNDWEYWLDENNKYIFISPSCKGITGYSEEYFYKKPDLFIDLVREDYKKEVSNHYHGENKRAPHHTLEFPIINKNNEEVWIEHSCIPIFDKDGKFLGRRGNNRNITDRIITSEKQRRDKQILDETGRLAKIGGWELNVETMTSYYSGETKKIYGLSLDDKPPKGIDGIKFYPIQAQKKIFQLVRDAMENGIPYDVELPFINKKGQHLWVRTIGTAEKNDGKVTRLYGTIQDITEKKKNERKLKTAKEKAEENEQKLKFQKEEIEFNNARLESLLRVTQLSTNSIQELLDYALHEAIELTNSKIGYIYFYDENNKQFSLNTWSRDVMKECEVMNPQTIYDLDSTGCWGEAVRQKKPIVINDYQAENPLKKGTPHGHVKLSKFMTIPVIFDGQIVAVSGVGNKPTDYDNSDIRQLTLLMDNVWKISERLSLQENLKLAKEKAEESDKLKSAFLANMSHEIRTPMNGILGFSELLKTPHLSDEEQQKYIRVIEKSGNRMLNIINDIVDISKIEAGLMDVNLNESNINEQIEYIYTFFKPEAEGKGMQIFFKNGLPTKQATIKTDREKVFAILTNLIKNAIKYSDEGSIEFGYVLKTGGEVAELSKKAELEFFIKDTGIGVPKDRQAAIFERFIQADVKDKMARQGAGLGLSITKAYVEILGGKIWLESEDGVGSTFYFTLPYTNELEVKSNIKDIKITYDMVNQVKNLKILIAEDDEVSSELLSTIVGEFSNKILIAKNGNEAVEICRNNPDIDVILMDIQMPEINGYEATRQIRQFNKKVIIIAQTAFGLAGDREKSLDAGCNDYITKPIKNYKLLTSLQKNFTLS